MSEHISESENILHENELGIILQCVNCNKIAIIINNIFFNCSEKEYNNLYETIQKINKNLDDYIFEIAEKKYIIISTAFENVNLIFDLNQFEQLTELFSQSKYMFNVHNLIS